MCIDSFTMENLDHYINVFLISRQLSVANDILYLLILSFSFIHKMWYNRWELHKKNSSLKLVVRFGSFLTMVCRKRTLMSMGSLVTESQERHSTARNCAHQDALYGERWPRIDTAFDHAVSAHPDDILRYTLQDGIHVYGYINTSRPAPLDKWHKS